MNILNLSEPLSKDGHREGFFFQIAKTQLADYQQYSLTTPHHIHIVINQSRLIIY